MAPLTKLLECTCLCGTTRADLPSPDTSLPLQAAFCHCTSCRRMSGCLCITSIPLASGVDEWMKTLSHRLKPFEFSKGHITHYFCPICGTHMLAEVIPRTGDEKEWFAMCGTIVDVDGLYFPSHEFVTDTIDGGLVDVVSCVYGISCPRWAGHPQDKEYLSIGWSSSTNTAAQRQRGYMFNASAAAFKCGLLVQVTAQGTRPRSVHAAIVVWLLAWSGSLEHGRMWSAPRSLSIQPDRNLFQSTWSSGQ